MKIFVGIYTGESSKDTLIRSPIGLGRSPTVYIVDLLYDGGCLDIKERLERAGIECRIKPGEGMGFDAVSNTVSRTCIEARNEGMRRGDDMIAIYLEIGNLDNILTGAMFYSAIRTGGRIVSFQDGKTDILSDFKPLPNVSRRGYVPRKILDTLYQEDALSYDAIAKTVYADEIAGMDDNEITEFFSRRHNTYKVLQNLREEGWIQYNKNDKTYTITPEGNTARVLFETMDIQKSKKVTGTDRVS